MHYQKYTAKTISPYQDRQIHYTNTSNNNLGQNRERIILPVDRDSQDRDVEGAADIRRRSVLRSLGRQEQEGGRLELGHGQQLGIIQNSNTNTKNNTSNNVYCNTNIINSNNNIHNIKTNTNANINSSNYNTSTAKSPHHHLTPNPNPSITIHPKTTPTKNTRTKSIILNNNTSLNLSLLNNSNARVINQTVHVSHPQVYTNPYGQNRYMNTPNTNKKLYDNIPLTSPPPSLNNKNNNPPSSFTPKTTPKNPHQPSSSSKHHLPNRPRRSTPISIPQIKIQLDQMLNQAYKQLKLQPPKNRHIGNSDIYVLDNQLVKSYVGAVYDQYGIDDPMQYKSKSLQKSKQISMNNNNNNVNQLNISLQMNAVPNNSLNTNPSSTILGNPNINNTSMNNTGNDRQNSRFRGIKSTSLSNNKANKADKNKNNNKSTNINMNITNNDNAIGNANTIVNVNNKSSKNGKGIRNKLTLDLDLGLDLDTKSAVKLFNINDPSYITISTVNNKDTDKYQHKDTHTKTNTSTTAIQTHHNTINAIEANAYSRKNRGQDDGHMGMAIRDTDKYAFVTPEKNTGYGGGGGVSSQNNTNANTNIPYLQSTQNKKQPINPLPLFPTTLTHPYHPPSNLPRQQTPAKSSSTGKNKTIERLSKLKYNFKCQLQKMPISIIEDVYAYDHHSKNRDEQGRYINSMNRMNKDVDFDRDIYEPGIIKTQDNRNITNNHFLEQIKNYKYKLQASLGNFSTNLIPTLIDQSQQKKDKEKQRPKKLYVKLKKSSQRSQDNSFNYNYNMGGHVYSQSKDYQQKQGNSRKNNSYVINTMSAQSQKLDNYQHHQPYSSPFSLANPSIITSSIPDKKPSPPHPNTPQKLLTSPQGQQHHSPFLLKHANRQAHKLQMKSRSKDIDISDDFVNKQVNDFGTNNNNNNVDYSSLSRFYPFTINNNTRIDKSPQTQQSPQPITPPPQQQNPKTAPYPQSHLLPKTSLSYCIMCEQPLQTNLISTHESKCQQLQKLLNTPNLKIEQILSIIDGKIQGIQRQVEILCSNGDGRGRDGDWGILRQLAKKVIGNHSNITDNNTKPKNTNNIKNNPNSPNTDPNKLTLTQIHNINQQHRNRNKNRNKSTNIQTTSNNSNSSNNNNNIEQHRSNTHVGGVIKDCMNISDNSQIRDSSYIASDNRSNVITHTNTNYYNPTTYNKNIEQQYEYQQQQQLHSYQYTQQQPYPQPLHSRSLSNSHKSNPNQQIQLHDNPDRQHQPQHQVQIINSHLLLQNQYQHLYSSQSSQQQQQQLQKPSPAQQHTLLKQSQTKLLSVSHSHQQQHRHQHQYSTHQYRQSQHSSSHRIQQNISQPQQQQQRQLAYIKQQHRQQEQQHHGIDNSNNSSKNNNVNLMVQFSKLSTIKCLQLLDKLQWFKKMKVKAQNKQYQNTSAIIITPSSSSAMHHTHASHHPNAHHTQHIQ